MKQTTLASGLIVAVAASLAAGALFGLLAAVAGAAPALKLVASGLGLGYVLYLLGVSGERTGRITTVAGWCLITCIAWAFTPTLTVYVLIQLGLLWLVRSLYHHSGLLPALADMGLTVLGLAAAVWAVQRTGSVFLATWCFFLVQALWPLIPQPRGRHKREPAAMLQPAGGFESAHRAAVAALRKLADKA
jgi:hypothetical protein